MGSGPTQGPSGTGGQSVLILQGHQHTGIYAHNGFGTHPRTIRDWEPDLMGLGPTQGPSGTGSQI